MCALIAATPANATPRSFYAWIRAEIDAFKTAGFTLPQTPTQPIGPPVKISARPVIPHIQGHLKVEVRRPASGLTLKKALAQFIEAKTSEGIQHKSVGQLQIRIQAFVTWAKSHKVDERTPCLAQDYRNALLRKPDLSFKTKSDYLAALKQFFRWCVILDYCSRNLFDGLTAGKRPVGRADDDRGRWHRPQLAQLYASLRSKQSQKGKKLKPQDFWVPLLCLYDHIPCGRRRPPGSA